MDVNYLNKRLMEDKNEVNPLSTESSFILVFCLTVGFLLFTVISLTICLFFVICYHYFNTDNLPTSLIDLDNPWMVRESDKNSNNIEDTKIKKKATKTTKSWRESRKSCNNKSPDVIWV